MCGRYTVFQTNKLTKRFKVTDTQEDELLENLRANYNVAPTQKMPVITQNSPRTMQLMQWGAKAFWDPKTYLFNTKSEGMFESRFWGPMVRKQRCLVPANAFYEWKKVKGEKQKQPMYIHPKDQELFAFAGIWGNWTDKATGEVLRWYSILTTTPNEEMKPIHNRMPVILHPKDEGVWLDLSNDSFESLADVLKPYDDGKLETYPISKKVGDAHNNDKHLIEPLPE